MKNFLVFLCLCISHTISSQNNLTPQQLRIDATFQHISVQYTFSGDDNLNSTMTVTFRKANSADAFQPGAKVVRAHPTMLVDGAALNLNFHAGSIMFLQPDTEYELQISLTDPMVDKVCKP